MPNKSFKQYLVLALFVLFALVQLNAGCNKSVPPAPEPSSIAGLINTGINFTILKAAMVKAGLEPQLNSAGNFTMFAPTNSAFATKGITIATINAASQSSISELLKYHIINTQAVKQANFPAMHTAINSMATTNNALYLNLNNALGLVNGFKLAQANIQANNGFIHVLDTVLTAPSQNIWAICNADTSLKLFRQAVNKTTTGATNILTLLNGTNNYSVFAPTNTAFKSAGYDSTAIANATATTLSSLLQYHLVNGFVFSTYLNNLDVLNTLNTMAANQPRAFISSDLFIKGNANSNTNQAKVITANNLATNGVLHIVNNVILP
jgi:uncharacterized surface protein with fasciclin (FAS1) repeats